jgi:erythrocyte band 7 integral membrane protein
VPCCCCFNPYRVVNQGNAGLLSHFGRVYKVIDPGLYFVNQFTEKLTVVDITLTISEAPRQIVMTKDNVSVEIDSVIYWHVVDPFKARFQVGDVKKALMERTMTTMKDTVGAHDLQSVITNRDALAHEIYKIIHHIAAGWGVVIESILVKDLQFSRDLQENLSSAAKQRRVGESKVIAAQSEVEAAKLMREASDILNTPAAMQIRYLETLQTMSRSPGTKVIFMPTSGEAALRDISNQLSLERTADGGQR